ncbi:MAG: hypothetical protein ACOYT4_02655 [Nanoarchaeota archaeon]
MIKKLEQEIENLHQNIKNNLDKYKREPEYVNYGHKAALTYLSGFFFGIENFDKILEEFEDWNVSNKITLGDYQITKFNAWQKYPDFFNGTNYEQRQKNFAYFLEKANNHKRDKMHKKVFWQDISPKLEGMMFGREFFNIESGCQQSGFNGLNRNGCIRSLTQNREIMDLAEDFYRLHSIIRLNQIEPEMRKQANEDFHSIYYGVMCKIYSNIADSIKNKIMPTEWAEDYKSFDENSPWIDIKNKIWQESEKSQDLFLRLIKSFQEHHNLIFDKTKYLERVDNGGYINWNI